MIGRIVEPHKGRREISVGRKNEYEQLHDTYCITHVIMPEGIGATLINGDLRCDVSFHRYENGSFYIGTPALRLGRVYTERFVEFLQAVGIWAVGTHVELDFDGYEIYISRL